MVQDGAGSVAHVTRLGLVPQARPSFGDTSGRANGASAVQ